MADRKRKHFGVLCSTIDIANQFNVWKGITEFAEANDIHVTAYIGTYQTTDNYFYSYLDSCFETMFENSGLLDGVIILSGFVAQNVGLDEFNKYIARVPPDIPAVSVSFEVQGIPSVVTYNKSGMYSAVDHLINVHGKKNIAFLKGPDGHPEAEARLQGYKDALEANGIPFNENYLFQGDFGREGGRNAVTELYDKRNITVDAIACCNDQSAVGVLQQLKTRNIMVPADIAVTGFDDDMISSIYVPAIATVGQDFVELGRVSAEILYKQITGESVPDITRVSPEYVPRQSCGCLGKESVYDDTGADFEETSDTFQIYVEKQFMKLLMPQKVSQEQIRTWVDMLVQKICATTFKREEFLANLDKILVTYYHTYSTEFSTWHKALIIMATALEMYKNEFENAHTILSTLTYATTLVYDIRMSEEKKKEYSLNDDRMRRRRHTNTLLLLFDADTLAEELCKTISELTMKTALIGIFHTPVKKTDEYPVRIIERLIGFDGEDKINLKHSSMAPIKLSDYSTLRGFNYDRIRRSMFFQPLFFMGEEVGVMLLPYEPDVPTDTYETLRINISTTLKGAQLMSTIHTLSVTDELTGLFNRRGFFQFAYSRLNHLLRTDETIPIVMFMDMDGLKLVNDTYGHKEGDVAIQAFAEILKSTMREEDIIGRMGGDEFAVLSSVKDGKNAEQLEGRLRKAYEEYNKKGIHPYQVNGSIGCVVLEQASRECFDAAMLSADSVLYEEKVRKKKMGLSR